MGRLGSFEENTIICGDAIEVMAQLPEACVDAIVIRICPVCGTQFQTTRNRIKFGRGIHCSRKCQYISNGEKLRKPCLTLVCKGCGKEFGRLPSELKNKNGGGQYCSTECAYQNKKVGKEAANWQGGKVEGNEKIRKSLEYKEWRQGVFERDNYTCRACGERGGKIHAHHIKSFAEHPELRLDIDNGVTLCKSCHKEGVMPNGL